MAQVGNDVLCIDTDEDKIERLTKGNISFHEPSLNRMISENIESGRLKFSTSPQEGVEHGLYQLIAVGTPIDDDGSINLDSVEDVAKSIATFMPGYRIIINKSTVPVGTADKVKDIISSTPNNHKDQFEFDVISNPEFLKEGAAIDDFMKPDRIIVGTDNPRTTELMKELYSPFNHGRDRMVIMDIRSAELTKYAATALLATKISFMNELANISELLDADIEQVRIGIGSDPRIGYHFIYPGCGYGGSRFPRDIQALKYTAKKIGYDAKLLHAVETVNNLQKDRPFAKLKQFYGDSLKDKTIALWGLSFKPETDDMRDASSSALMKALWSIGATIKAYDPIARERCSRIYGKRNDLILCQSADDALQDSDALVVVTEWQEFRSPDFDKIKSMLKDPVIIDGRNLYKPKYLKELGFTYFGIGRGE